MAVDRREARQPPLSTQPPIAYLVHTGRRVGFGEVRALSRAFERVASRHPCAKLRDVYSDKGFFAAVIEVRPSRPRLERVAARLFDEAWYAAFGPLTCPYQIERVAKRRPTRG